MDGAKVKDWNVYKAHADMDHKSVCLWCSLLHNKKVFPTAIKKIIGDSFTVLMGSMAFFANNVFKTGFMNRCHMYFYGVFYSTNIFNVHIVSSLYD